MDAYLLIFISYFIGSIPTGFIVARWFGIADIRLHGSGNIGATNVSRILGPLFFVPIFLFDALKAYSNIVLFSYIGYQDSFLILAAIAHLIGNGCSLFLNGQGGKGVATSVGLLGALQPALVPHIGMTWLLLFLYTKTVGIASIISALCIPVYAWLCGYSHELLFFSCCISIWIVVRHYANLKNALVNKIN